MHRVDAEVKEKEQGRNSKSGVCILEECGG